MRWIANSLELNTTSRRHYDAERVMDGRKTFNGDNNTRNSAESIETIVEEGDRSLCVTLRLGGESEKK